MSDRTRQLSIGLDYSTGVVLAGHRRIEYDNTLLSFARAEAVRTYRVARGVPEFILRVEGRGEADASGGSGADRRVEIEVIDGP